MIGYEPGGTVPHRLDPRTKLCFQVGFGIAVFSRTGAAWLVASTLVSVALLWLVDLSVRSVARTLWFLGLFLVFAPLVAGVNVRPVGFTLSRTADSLLALGRVVPVLFVSVVYVRTTSVRETRAAIQRTVPGKPGQLFGVGVALVVRLFPLLLSDLRRTRAAIRARGGNRRSTVHQVRLLVTGTLSRAFTRADRLSVALRARCFSWNPTLPRLSFSILDYPVLAFSLCLLVTPFL